MGKTGKWFRSLLSSKKNAPPPKSKCKYVENPLNSPYVEGRDANKHAIAVAAATAAVAEAALAAAQAAAEVVRLTSGCGSVRNVRSVASFVRGDRRRVAAAAVMIQSAFRAYLARRALRALKGLVKLQALVRGHIVRKQSANMLRRMQAMARIQARASANRASTSDASNSKTNFSNSHHPGAINIGKFDMRSNSTKHGGSKVTYSRPHSSNIVNKESSHKTSNWLDQWMEQCKSNNHHNTSLDTPPGDDEKSDKILEIDTWKPHPKSKPTSQYISPWNDTKHNYSKIGSKIQKPNPSISSEEVSSVIDQVAAWTAEINSPGVHSASSQPIFRGPFTPKRSECSRSLFGDYLSHPNYMANTESSKAKVRSLSAPKQRMQLEELALNSKFGHNVWESDAVSEKGSTLRANYRSNSYLQSGQLKKQGHPTHGSTYGYVL
ncbi:hypothetical protein ACJIZ3_009219 [Penstemon smallii]|uniref:DUF4005 domain-containing protein n=1 Tax=Penstemon smallii TaxID=265156 RepID=A0ABD3TE61_9LAMI